MLKKTLKTAWSSWMKYIENDNTRNRYQNTFRALVRWKVLKPLQPVFEFATLNLNQVLDQIGVIDHYSFATRQNMAAAFIAFTKFLNRSTNGQVPVAVPAKLGVNRTFFTIREKVKTQAHPPALILSFIDSLQRINPQHALIARIAYQGAKRVSEVLNLKIEDIQYQKKILSFKQSKTRGTDKKTAITYSPMIFDQLKAQVNGRAAGVVFLENGGKIDRLRLNYTFSKASRQSGVKVTPHVLRASAITEYSARGIDPAQIAKVTGTQVETVRKYDKTALEDNITKDINLLEPF